LHTEDNAAVTCNNNVDLPIPGSPPISKTEPATKPPPQTRSSSLIPDFKRNVVSGIPSKPTKSILRPPFPPVAFGAEAEAVSEIIEKRLLKNHEGKQFKSALKIKNEQNCIDINLARRKMVMVFQHFNLFKNMTVLKNLTYAPVKLKLLTEEEAIKKAEALLERIGLPDKKNDYPVALSGGQQQRVAIARSLMVNPEVILFDEPTSALDPIMVGEVLNLVKELASDGLTMVIVTHEMSFAREVASKMVFISDGKIIESAPPAEFFDSPKTAELKEFLSKVL
jgi:polar amino acid transport system ATP-binding protein